MTTAKTDTQSIATKNAPAQTSPEKTATHSTGEHNTDVDNTQPQAQTQAAYPNIETSTDTPEPAVKKVDIVIAGITYQIYCPINEEQELRSAVYFINNSVLDIKKQAPNLTQENMLVLCCLNLFEKMHSQQKTDEKQRLETEQSVLLLNKILQDAQSVL